MKRVVSKPFPTRPEVRDPADIGRAIAAARSQSGMSQAEAALFCGVSKQTFASIEQGRPGSAIGTVLRVAQQFGVAVLVAPRQVSAQAEASIQALLTKDEHGS